MLEEQKQLAQQVESLFEIGDVTALSRLLNEHRSGDIAEVVTLVDNEKKRTIFDILDKHTSAEVLEKVEEATRGELFELLEETEIKDLFAELDYDDATDLLVELPVETRTKVLRSLTPADAEEITELMRYPEESAGGIMDPVVISLRENATAGEAINKIRASNIDEDFYSVYVVDKNNRFLGDVRIRLLLTSPEETKIGALVDSEAIYVDAEADQEQVRNIFSKYNLIVVPVLDSDHRLVGRITADRILEVAEEEAAEDMYAMAGTEPEELDKFSALHAARVRMTWLLPCLIGTSITALVMMFFKNLDPAIFVIAVSFVPMIAAISGNAGLQTSTIVVSGLATGHLAALKFSQVFTREVRIALVVAICCGIIGGLLCGILLKHKGAEEHAVPGTIIVMAFGCGMFAAIMVATTLGLLLPFVFRRIGFDPAISSGPLVTTANDSMSVAIYLTLTLLLAG